MDKLDVRRLARSFDDVVETGVDSFDFRRNVGIFCVPYLKRVDPEKARIPRYDRFVVRVRNV